MRLLQLLVLCLASTAIAAGPSEADVSPATHVQIPSVMLMNPHLFKTTMSPFRAPHTVATRDGTSTVDALRIRDEFSHHDSATGHVVEMTTISSTAPNIVYLDLLPNIEAVKCDADSLEIFFLPLTADAKASASAKLTYGTKAKHYASATHVTGGNKFVCASGSFVQRAVASVTSTSERAGGVLSSIKLATRVDEQFMFANTDYSIVLNGSVAVVPKATFFKGHTFNLAQAAARVFAGSGARASTRATCVGSDCFDTIFDQALGRTSVDLQTNPSITMYMNYNNVTRAVRTTSVVVDSRGQTPNPHNFLVQCIDCWTYVSASITFAASFQLLDDTTFPPAQFQKSTVRLNILYLRFSIDGKFVVNFNQVAAFVPPASTVAPGSPYKFPKKRSVVIQQSSVNLQSAAFMFPDPPNSPPQKVPNPLKTTPVTAGGKTIAAPLNVAEQCEHLGDCFEALHARSSRLVQPPPTPHVFNSFFQGINPYGNNPTPVDQSGFAYDNEVLLEPIFTALPTMDNILSMTIPFSQPLTITSSLGLGVQNRWIPDETTFSSPSPQPNPPLKNYDILEKVQQFSLEHGVQVTLDVKSDLFAFSKLTDNCLRTQEYLSDPTAGGSQVQCLAVFSEAGVRPSFIKALADMAPKDKTGRNQKHADVLNGKCTIIANKDSPNEVAPTTVPPNWLTTPYVIHRTSKLTASFGFVGPSLRISASENDNLLQQPHEAPSISADATKHKPNFVNTPARNILLETELFPIMRTTIVGLELFVVPYLSSHVQIKLQAKNEPGPCDAASSPQLFFTAPNLYAHKVYQFVRIKSLTLQQIQSPGSASCPTNSNCQVTFSGVLIPPKCSTDLNIGHTTPTIFAEKDKPDVLIFKWHHPVLSPDASGGYNPACSIPIGTPPAAAIDDGHDKQTQLTNRRRAAYWDAAEKYYSVCQFGRTSVSNDVGQYNPNVKVEGGSTKPFSTNPDARYSNLYNIHYSHNSGLSSGYAPLPFAPTTSADPLYYATTYNPESFPSEVQFFMHPLQAASFPMCIARGTSTPSGVVSASVVDGLNVLLPLSRVFAETSGSVLYNAFIRIEANALPAGSTVVASTAPGITTVSASTLPGWALNSGLNTLIIAASTPAGRAITRLPTNAIRTDIDFTSSTGVSGNRRLANAIQYILVFCPKTVGCLRSDWVHMSCGSSFVAGSVSSSMGSTCSINSGRVSMATPSFGTYYLAQSSTVTAAPAPQTIAALPPPAVQPSPVPVATQPPSPVELTDSLIAGIFFGGVGSGFLFCGVVAFLYRVLSTKAPAASAAQPSAQAAWQIEMAPRAPERESNFVSSPSQRSPPHSSSPHSPTHSASPTRHQVPGRDFDAQPDVSMSSTYGHLARSGGSPGSRERSMAYNADSSYSQSALRSERANNYGGALGSPNYGGALGSPSYSRQGSSRHA